MNEVKRYDAIDDDGHYSIENIEISKSGLFTLYADFQSERALRIEAEKKLHELQDAIKDRKDIRIKGYKDQGYFRQDEIDKLFDKAIEESRKRREGK